MHEIERKKKRDCRAMKASLTSAGAHRNDVIQHARPTPTGGVEKRDRYV